MKLRYIYFIIIILVLLMACSKEEDEVKPEEVAESNEPENKPVNDLVYPLTGIENSDDVTNRIVSVMVNNHPAARPQTGLSQADIVFEILAEGEITRFLALYQSEQPEVVGPVRSAREYYFGLANGYEALYVYHGAIWFVKDILDEQGTEFLDGTIHDNDGKLFKRESFRKAPHNSYLQFDAVYDYATSKGYEITQEYEPLPFLKEDEVIDGDAATHIEVMYPGRNASGYVGFSYDKQNENYMRSEGENQTVELDTNDPILVENVLIIEADHRVFDDEGRREVDLKTGGDAYLFQKGKMQKVEWENKDGRIIPMLNGQPVGFVQGKTWINVVPSNPSIEQSVTITNE